VFCVKSTVADEKGRFGDEDGNDKQDMSGYETLGV
jgi:hypothetical protein